MLVRPLVIFPTPNPLPPLPPPSPPLPAIPQSSPSPSLLSSSLSLPPLPHTSPHSEHHPHSSPSFSQPHAASACATATAAADDPSTLPSSPEHSPAHLSLTKGRSSPHIDAYNDSHNSYPGHPFIPVIDGITGNSSSPSVSRRRRDPASTKRRRAAGSLATVTETLPTSVTTGSSRTGDLAHRYSSSSSVAIGVGREVRRRAKRRADVQKGKGRAASRSRIHLITGSIAQEDIGRERERDSYRRYRRPSSLSLSTIHSWCPYCHKTIPSEDQSDHHQSHRQFNLISPTPTPQRTHSRSPSLPRSCSVEVSPSVRSLETFQSTHCSSSPRSNFSSDLEITPPSAIPSTLFTFTHPLPHLVASAPAVYAPETNRTETAFVYTGNRDSVAQGTLKQRVDPASTPSVSPTSSPSQDTASSNFTHRRSDTTPLPHPPPPPPRQHIRRLQESRLEATVNRFLFFSASSSSANSSNFAVASSSEGSLSRSEPSRAVANQNFSTRVLQERAPEHPDHQLGARNKPTRFSLPASTPLYTHFRTSLEVSPWFSSFPVSSDGEDSKIRSPNHLSSGKSAARSKGSPVQAENQSSAKRRSWTFFTTFRNRRLSLPARAVSSTKDRPNTANSTPSVLGGALQHTAEKEHEAKIQPRPPVSHSKRHSAPPIDRGISAMLATQEPQPIQPTMPAPPHRQTFFSGSIFQDHKKEATAANRHRSSMIYDQNKPLPAILDANQPAPQSPTNSSKGSSSQQKKQRRMSFLPSALMTSNLAKFMGGSSNGGSPTTSNLSPATSPRTPRSPMAIPPLHPVEHPIGSIKEADSESDDGTQLTTEQFKWAMVCCCNEIKSRVIRHRCTPITEAQARPCSTTEAATSVIVSGSSSVRKADKNKSSRFGGNSSPSHAIEAAPKDSQVVMQGLLQVMVSLTDAENKIGSGDDGDSSSIHMADSSSSLYSTPSHPPPPVISRNKSFLSLIGVGSASRHSSAAAAAAAPKRTRSITQLSHHSSFPSLVPSLSTPYSPYPSAHQHQQLHHHQLPQQLHDRPKFLRSKKSQTKLALAQATDAILSPLSLEELVHLMAYTLTIAPEQWIPWHLYDFFVRPQGMKYRDLIELLPTQSQRILRSILETVDALVDHAVLIVVQHHQLQQQSRATEKVAPAPATTTTTDGGSGNSGVNRLRQQSSQVHLRSKSEIYAGSVHKASGGGRNESAGGLSVITQAMTMAITKPTASSPSPLDRTDGSGPGGEDLILHEVAIRARKRRAILDSLSGLVFRSRKDVTASSVYGSEPTTSFAFNRDFNVAEDRHKGKRRSSVAAVASGFTGTRVTSTGTTAATQALHVQLSEREREAGHKAFENLVYAFEEEYHPHKPAAGSAVPTLGGVGAETGSSFFTSALSQSHSAPAAGAMAALQGRLGPNIPRQSRSLPTPLGPTIADMSAVRSLSLPPWRKHSSTVSLVQPSSVSSPTSPHHLQSQASSLDPLQKSLTIPSGSVSASAPATPTEARAISLSITQAQLDHHTHPLSLPSESGSVAPTSASSTGSELAWTGNARQRPLSFPLGINTKQQGDSAGTSRRRSSARLSATWTSWKDHLLVLEEEEYVIGDTSESEVESSKSKTEEEEEDEEGEDGTMDAATAAGLQQQAQATRKKSGTFGTLPMMPVGSLEASDQRTDEQEKAKDEKERMTEVETGQASHQ
ncbi:unnamed protein product [Mortierella alpina]